MSSKKNALPFTPSLQHRRLEERRRQLPACRSATETQRVADEIGGQRAYAANDLLQLLAGELPRWRDRGRPGPAAFAADRALAVPPAARRRSARAGRMPAHAFPAPAAAAPAAGCPAAIAAACRREPARSPRTGSTRRAPVCSDCADAPRQLGRRARPARRLSPRRRAAAAATRGRVDLLLFRDRRFSRRDLRVRRRRRSTGSVGPGVMPVRPGRVEARLVGAVEEPGQRVEVLVADRVVLVIVAARAADGQPEERRCRSCSCDRPRTRRGTPRRSRRSPSSACRRAGTPWPASALFALAYGSAADRRRSARCRTG